MNTRVGWYRFVGLCHSYFAIVIVCMFVILLLTRIVEAKGLGRFLKEVESWAKNNGYEEIELSSSFYREVT